MAYTQYASIFIEGVPFHLTYGIPDDMKAEVGSLVSVPIQKKHQFGVVTEITDEIDLDKKKIKPLLKIDNFLSNQPLIIDLCHTLAKYYTCSWAFILLQFAAHLPKEYIKSHFYKRTELPIKKPSPSQKQLLDTVEEYTKCSGFFLHQRGFQKKTINVLCDKSIIEEALPDEIDQSLLVTLNSDQQSFVDQYNLNSFHIQLLWGVTGSGKTECFTHLISKITTQILILVPEIGLVAPTASKISSRLGIEVLTYHSSMSDSEKNAARSSIIDGQHKVIVATRSGVFLSYKNLGLIIIDEEHDPSYQQDSRWHYHARDIAIWRAKTDDIPILMASATPSLSTIHNVNIGKFSCFHLKKKALNTSETKVYVTDLNKQKVTKGFATSTLQAITDTLAKNQHVIVFINRRGYAPRFSCEDCGWVAQCKECSASVVFHAKKNCLMCHHCGKTYRVFTHCQDCNSENIKPVGYGTEQIESYLSSTFSSPVWCIDQDNSDPKLLGEKISELETLPATVIVGTQMISKGHDFKRVGLIVIHQIDLSMFAHDPYSPERFIHQYFQIQGRCARSKDEKGTIIIQTRNPDNFWVKRLYNQEIYELYDQLLLDRKESNLPPYSYHAKVIAESKHPKKAFEYLKKWQESVKLNDGLWLGPAPCVLEKRAGFYRFQCHIVSPTRTRLIKNLSLIKSNLPPKSHHSLRTQIAMDQCDS